jgi:single-strand DNA-binding protein
MKAMKNTVQLIGNVGMDPEVRSLENGGKMARISMATNETYQNAKGEKVTDTQWHYLVAWGKTADLFDKYVVKGQELVVQGKLINRSYTTPQGEKKYITEIQVQEVMMLRHKK